MNTMYPGSLHNHTDYSNLRLRDAISTVPGLIKRAIELGHKGIAFTEHETVANAIEIEEQWDKVLKTNPDFKVIRGNEIYLVRNGLNNDNFDKNVDKYTHFILLALDAKGHEQIRQLSAAAWTRSYMARGMRRVPTYYSDLFSVIGSDPGHVVATTACIGGALGTQLLRYKATQSLVLYEKIKSWCVQLKNLFGANNFYLELQPSKNPEQVYVNQKIIDLSHELDIPVIITNDSHYIKKEDLAIEKVFLNSQGGDREVESFYATTYLMSDEEIRSYMVSQIGAEELEKAYTNIESILGRATYYSLKKPLKIPSLLWRQFEDYSSEYNDWVSLMPTLKNFINSKFESDRQLVNAVIAGIKSHSDLRNPEAYNELDLCLQDTWVSSQVNKAQWSAYFLNLQKIIDVCWDAGTLVGCGRGSGVGFLLLYCLDITQINPLREKTKTFRFRFLNPERVSVLDIDSDITGLNRDKILEAIRKVYGQDRVANVLTLRTEKPKSAILAAARGLGIEVDVAQYLASLIPSERGQLWSLEDCMFGNEEEGRQPVKQFVTEMTEHYPEIWNIVQKTSNLIVGMGEHAGGIIFVDEPFEESTSLCRAPNGDIMTQYELHTAEKASLIKMDMLSVEAVDKIQICINLLQEYNYIDPKLSLREAYEKAIGIYNLERDDPEMWKMVEQNKILSLFQMDAPSGKNGIAILKPQSVDELSILNSAIRLMAQEKGGEMPVEKLARFKKDSSEWDKEIAEHGLDVESTRTLLEPILNTSFGLCIAQEQFMQLVQMPELGGMSLTDADALRKSIAKKNPAAYDKWIDNYRKVCKEKGIDEKLTNYIIELISMSKGYGFNLSHTLAYSLVGLQEMNLAYKYPILFWNTACLISDSGGSDNEDEEQVVEAEIIDGPQEEYYNEMEDFSEDEDDEDDIESSYEEEDCDGYKAKVCKMADGKKKKKKAKTANFGKIATAIGKMKDAGIAISAPDINLSTYTFSPDLNTNTIRYGLSGITRVGDDLVKEIIANRPYSSFNDLCSKVKFNKTQLISLIKSGAFDSFGERSEIMNEYLKSVSKPKESISLRNMKTLTTFGLIPEDLSFQVKVYNFTKYIRKQKLTGFYGLDKRAFAFYEANGYDMDKLLIADTESGFKVNAAYWDKVYNKEMDKIRNWIKPNAKWLLEQVNQRQIDDLKKKYCNGNYSTWEMSAISCYIHDHELANIDKESANISDFDQIPENPQIDRFIYVKGKQIPLFRLYRIAGTVLDKNKMKKSVTLLTTDNKVVTVKVYGVFPNYDKQISEMGADGHKHVIEKSTFARGNKLIITGIREGDDFVAKVYKNSMHDRINIIEEVREDGSFTARKRVEQ